jgi:hypothetical protein
MSTVATVVAVVLAALGLVAVGAFMLLSTALQSLGSSK